MVPFATHDYDFYYNVCETLPYTAIEKERKKERKKAHSETRRSGNLNPEVE
jgi:hypothetical protein